MASELTHIYHGAKKKKQLEITVASPKGGDTPIDRKFESLFTHGWR